MKLRATPKDTFPCLSSVGVMESSVHWPPAGCPGPQALQCCKDTLLKACSFSQLSSRQRSRVFLAATGQLLGKGSVSSRLLYLLSARMLLLHSVPLWSPQHPNAGDEGQAPSPSVGLQGW